MAKKKAAGSLRNGRDSRSKRLGLKIYGGEYVKKGNIIIRQQGNKYYSGINTTIGKDFTILTRINGIVYYTKKNNKSFVNVKDLF